MLSNLMHEFYIHFCCDFTGSVLKWKSVYESLKKFADAEGKEYLQNVQDELAPIDVALQNNDMAGVAKSLHVAAPNIKKLSAHVKNNMLKNFAKMNSKLIETLVIPKLEQEGSTIEDFNVYLVETTRSVKGIFSKLLNMVFDLMGNVVDEISPDME